MLEWRADQAGKCLWRCSLQPFFLSTAHELAQANPRCGRGPSPSKLAWYHSRACIPQCDFSQLHPYIIPPVPFLPCNSTIFPCFTISLSTHCTSVDSTPKAPPCLPHTGHPLPASARPLIRNPALSFGRVLWKKYLNFAPSSCRALVHPAPCSCHVKTAILAKPVFVNEG